MFRLPAPFVANSSIAWLPLLPLWSGFLRATEMLSPGLGVLNIQFSSVQFSRSVVSNSLRLHEPQHARPPCPSPLPGVHPNPCPSSQWCHPAVSSSVVPFSSCPLSFPASESFPTTQLFASGGQSIAVSASNSVLPMNTQDWSPLGDPTYWSLIIVKELFPAHTG